MFSGRCDVEIKDSIHSGVHEKCDFQLPNCQLRPLRVVLRGVTAVKAGYIDTNDPVGREKQNREVEENPPNRHSKPVERFT